MPGRTGRRPAQSDSPRKYGRSRPFYGVWVIPALLALIDRPAANWTSLIFDGIRDGSHLVFLALLATTLPCSFAIALSWQRLRTA